MKEDINKTTNNNAYIKTLLFDARLLTTLQTIGVDIGFIERDYSSVNNENVNALMRGAIDECIEYTEKRNINVGIDFKELFVE